MPPEIDLRTVTFITSIFCYVYSIAVFFFALKASQHKGLYHNAAADFILASGMLLLFFRDYIGDNISVVLSNTLIHISVIVNHVAFAIYRNTSIRKMTPYITTLVIIQITGFIYFTTVNPDILKRVIIITLVISAQLLLMIVTMLKVKKVLNKSDRTLMYLTGFFALFFTVRALTSFSEYPLQSLMDAGYLHSASIAAFLLWVTIKTFALFNSVTEEMVERINQTARIDTLTNLYNRRGLNEIAEREFNKLIREMQPLSLAICDLDYFKEINDNYGHTIGDRALMMFASLLRRNTRKIDVCARWGGDEFVIILPNTNNQEALKIIEKIRKLCSRMTIDKKIKLKITASFGIASYQDGMDVNQLIKKADQALYESKRHGRNTLASCVE